MLKGGLRVIGSKNKCNRQSPVVADCTLSQRPPSKLEPRSAFQNGGIKLSTLSRLTLFYKADVHESDYRMWWDQVGFASIP
jgi:hypothetical protein